MGQIRLKPGALSLQDSHIHRTGIIVRVGRCTDARNYGGVQMIGQANPQSYNYSRWLIELRP